MQSSIFSNAKVGYGAVLLAALALYVVSCAPGTLWQDSGMYQYRIWHNDIEGRLGLALSHPLYHIIGIGVKYIPLGEFAYRLNLISAIAAAFTIANLFLLLRLWLGKNLPAIIAAATLALSWTTWQFASIAEVYTLHSALFLAELIMLFQYIKTRRIGFLYLLALFNGLSIANHMWGVIAFACYFVFLAALLVQKQIRLKHFGIIAGLWIFGAAPYEYLIIKNIFEDGFWPTLASAAFGNDWRGQVLNTHLSARLVKENLIFLAYNFSTPNCLLFFVGLYGLKKVSPSRGFKNVLLALLILFFVFAFRYTVPDRYAFFMPFYCLVSILMGLGFDILAKHKNRTLICTLALIFTLLPIPAYIIAPVLAEKIQFKLPTKRTIPYRNDYLWFLQPWQRANNAPELFAREALARVENEAIIIADGTTVYPLWYLQEVKETNPDIKVLSEHRNYKNPIPFPAVDTIAELVAERAIYVVSPKAGYCPDYLLKHYDFRKAGPIYLVVDRQ
jgi:hypothetical protein